MVDRVRSLFPQTRNWFAIVGGATFRAARDGRLVPDFESLTHRRVRRQDNAGHTITPAFARTFDQPTRIANTRNERYAVELTPLGARPSTVQIQDGVVVYASAYVDTDVMYKSTPTHTDEYLLLHSRRAPTTWRFRVARGVGIARLRQAGNSIEAVDGHGVAWLRANRPKAIDRDGKRAEGTIRVVDDEIVVSIDTRALSLPILVDPDWKSTGDMSHGRFHFQATELPDGRVLTTGGCSSSVCSGTLALAACPNVVTAMEALDLDSRTWSTLGDSASKRFFHSAALLGDGRVLLAGGCTNSDCSAVTNMVELFAPGNGMLTSPVSLSTGRAAMSSAVLGDGRVLLAGGCTSASCTGESEIFTPTSTSLDPAGTMTSARGRAATVILADGRVMAIGGCTTIGCTSVLSSAEIYDPVANTWTATGPMATARAGHFAARLSDGRVLVGGGCADQVCSEVLRSAEIFDPVTGTFSPAGQLAQARVGAVARSLPDGVVLVSQGCAGPVCDLTNELYTPGTGFALTDPALTSRGFHELLVIGSRRLALAIGGCTPTTCSWWTESWDVAQHFAGVADAGPRMTFDAGPFPDAGRGGNSGGSCGCRNADGAGGAIPAALVLIGLLVSSRRRRRQTERSTASIG